MFAFLELKDTYTLLKERKKINLGLFVLSEGSETWGGEASHTRYSQGKPHLTLYQCSSCSPHIHGLRLNHCVYYSRNTLVFLFPLKTNQIYGPQNTTRELPTSLPLGHARAHALHCACSRTRVTYWPDRARAALTAPSRGARRALTGGRSARPLTNDTRCASLTPRRFLGERAAPTTTKLTE